MSVPRLLAIAPDGWHESAAFSAQLHTLRAHTGPLGPRVAVYLRAHGWDRTTWRNVLARLARPDNLALGITLPVDAELPEDSEWLRECGVDFVHLTERDADRPLTAWAGVRVSRVCHDPAAARRRWQLGADWLVVSPVFATPSKPGAPTLGVAGLQEAVGAVPGRVLALGGISAENAGRCVDAGASGVAVQRTAWHDVTALSALLA